MNLLWGLSMIVIGLFFLICSTVKSEFIVYRLMVARSKLLWREENRVHRFYQFTGLIIMTLGALWALGIIWSP